jgi:hypothetical protein
MHNESDNAGQIVGTCKITVHVRDGSPLLKDILSRVGIDGLPDEVCSDRQGLLAELIDARQQQLLQEAQCHLNGLEDDHLVAEVLAESSECVDLALEILAERIKGGSTSAFGALVDALRRLEEQDIPPDSFLEERVSDLIDVYDSGVAAARPSVDHLTERELENIINKGQDDSVRCAARERLEEIHQRTRDLAAIKTMPLHEVIEQYNEGHFLDPQVRRRARERLARETVGDVEIADLLPFGEHRVKDFLERLGVQCVGCLDARRARCRGPRWNREEVMQTIQNTTARLFFRARDEFDGPLPDHLHAAMMFAPADEYQRAYSDWLKRKGW